MSSSDAKYAVFIQTNIDFFFMKVSFFQLIVKVIKSHLSHKSKSDKHFNQQINCEVFDESVFVQYKVPFLKVTFKLVIIPVTLQNDTE